jgi:hypothetical protein
MSVVVLVKAAPVLTSRLEETMCVAGVRVDDEPTWVRLHPVPFRDLGDQERFAKYQVVAVDAIRPRSDRRPESWTPIHGSIVLGEKLGTADRWAARRQLIARVAETNMCDLIEANSGGSGPGVPSLAIVRPAGPPRLLIGERDADQLAEWDRRAKAAAGRPSLFDDPTAEKPELEVVPWRFRYDYRCRAAECKGHKQTIVDWEVAALWRRVRHRDNWRDLMREKFEDDLWAGKDTVLFVGNMEQRPWNFLVLGVFWPPSGPRQQLLEL